MNTVREISVAEHWLPARFSLSAFRLIGLVVALWCRRRVYTGSEILQQQRDQHPLEPYTLSIVFTAIPFVHSLAALHANKTLSLTLLVLVALVLPVAIAFAWETVAFCVGGLLWTLRRYANISLPKLPVQTAATHGTMIAIAAFAVVGNWPTSWLGVVWLALVASNAICFVIMRIAVGVVNRLASEISGRS